MADGDQVGWDAILVFDSLGSYQFRSGGPGEGPGEFRQLWWASSYRGDSIIGFDMGGDKVNVYGPDGAYHRQVRLPAIPTEPAARGTVGFTAGMAGAYADGWFLAYPYGALDIEGGVGPAWRKHLLLRLSPDAQVWDTLGSFEIEQGYWDGTREHQLWFSPYAQRLVGSDRLYHARGDRFEVREVDTSGRLRRIIRRDHEALPVTQEWKDRLQAWFMDRVGAGPGSSEEELSQVRALFTQGEYATHVPAISGLVEGPEGTLWVEEFRWFVPNERAPVDDPGHWSVFDSTGVWLGRVETPPHFALRAVTESRALGFVIDEFDVKAVHVYALMR